VRKKLAVLPLLSWLICGLLWASSVWVDAYWSVIAAGGCHSGLAILVSVAGPKVAAE